LFSGDPVAVVYPDGREVLLTPERADGLVALALLVALLWIKFRHRVDLWAVQSIADVELLTIDEGVAKSWALLRVHLASEQRRLNVSDLWAAATGLAHGIPVVTRDDDFGPVEGVAGLRVVRV